MLMGIKISNFASYSFLFKKKKKKKKREIETVVFFFLINIYIRKLDFDNLKRKTYSNVNKYEV